MTGCCWRSLWGFPPFPAPRSPHWAGSARTDSGEVLKLLSPPLNSVILKLISSRAILQGISAFMCMSFSVCCMLFHIIDQEVTTSETKLPRPVCMRLDIPPRGLDQGGLTVGRLDLGGEPSTNIAYRTASCFGTCRCLANFGSSGGPTIALFYACFPVGCAIMVSVSYVGVWLTIQVPIPLSSPGQFF